MTTKQTQLLNAISRAGEHGLMFIGAVRAVDSNTAGTSRIINELLKKGLIREGGEIGPYRYFLS